MFEKYRIKVGLVIVGLLLALKAMGVLDSLFDIIKFECYYPLDFEAIVLLFKRGILLEFLTVLIGLIGLFIPKKIGYVLLQILSFYILGFFVFTKPNFKEMWIHLLFALIILIFANLKMYRKYFKIRTLRQSLFLFTISMISGVLISIL
jgi:hypothetical protein